MSAYFERVPVVVDNINDAMISARINGHDDSPCVEIVIECVVRTAGERPATIHVPLLVARDWARAVLELVERELGPEDEL